MSIDAEKLLKDMFEAGADVIRHNGLVMTELVENELKGVLAEIAQVAKDVEENLKDPTQGYPIESGKALLQNQIVSLNAVLMGIEEMVKTTAQQAINAVLDVIRSAAGGILKALV